MTTTRGYGVLYLSIAILISIASSQPIPCFTSVDCPPSATVCMQDLTCGPCQSAMDCVTMWSEKPICNAGACQPCLSDADCNFMAPRSASCNATAGRCDVINIKPSNTVLPGAIAIGVVYTFLAVAVVVLLLLTIFVPEVQELRSSYTGTNSTAMTSRGSIPSGASSDRTSRN